MVGHISRAPPRSSSRRRSRWTERVSASARGNGANACSVVRLALHGCGALDEIEPRRSPPLDRRSAARRQTAVPHGADDFDDVVGLAKAIERNLRHGVEPVVREALTRARQARDDRCPRDRAGPPAKTPVSVDPAARVRSRGHTLAGFVDRRGPADETHFDRRAPSFRRPPAATVSTRPNVTRSADRARRAASPRMPTAGRSGELSTRAASSRVSGSRFAALASMSSRLPACVVMNGVGGTALRCRVS